MALVRHGEGIQHTCRSSKVSLVFGTRSLICLTSMVKDAKGRLMEQYREDQDSFGDCKTGPLNGLIRVLLLE